MKTYTVLLKANAAPVLVREGFSWGGLMLGPLWLAAHRAWTAAAICLAASVLIVTFAAEPAGGILMAGVALVLGLTGNDLRRWALENRGYLLVHVVSAGNPDDAYVRLLTFRPDLAARFRPEPAW